MCTCPSRALIQADIYDEFMARCLERIARIKQGNPLDTDTQLGPQVSAQQLEKIASYVDIGRNEGAEVLIGGRGGRASQRRGHRQRLLLPADGAEGRQQDAGIPGDRPRAGGHHLHRRRGRPGDRE